MADTWRAVKTDKGSAQVVSYISDDLPGFLVFNQGNDFRSMRGQNWQVFLLPLHLVGTIDLETVEKLVGAVRRGAVNAIGADSGKTLAAAKQAAREHADLITRLGPEG